MIKWRPNGRRAWVARYASPYGMEDYSSGAACDGKGNVYVAGFRYLLGNQDADWVMTKFRASDGKRLWVRVWSGTEKSASDDRRRRSQSTPPATRTLSATATTRRVSTTQSS